MFSTHLVVQYFNQLRHVAAGFSLKLSLKIFTPDSIEQKKNVCAPMRCKQWKHRWWFCRAVCSVRSQQTSMKDNAPDLHLKGITAWTQASAALSVFAKWKFGWRANLDKDKLWPTVALWGIFTGEWKREQSFASCVFSSSAETITMAALSPCYMQSVGQLCLVTGSGTNHKCFFSSLYALTMATRGLIHWSCMMAIWTICVCVFVIV